MRIQTHEMGTPVQKSSSGYTITLPASSAAVFFSEQDGSASGIAWVAREPQLMYGAKVRTSLLRSIDYHNFACLRQYKIGGNLALNRGP